jgi:ATP diphosphatase
MNIPTEAGDIRRLLHIMAKLRNPDGGCPWDLEQSFETIVPYTIEEAYEVADAIENRDMERLQDELGDLLFQVVFYAQMAHESDGFDFADVVAGVSEKMIRRHPHVFGNTEITDADSQSTAWETHKAKEREGRANAEGRQVSVLDDVARGLPALLRAHKLQKRAARVGFDWTEMTDVESKIDEELAELREAVSAARTNEDNHHREAIAEEYGDVLFSLVNFARHLDIEPETALRDANVKFERRFRDVESEMTAAGRDLNQVSLTEYDKAWERAKARERDPQTSNHEISTQVEEAQ